jgi:uncharacterized membrane protein
MPFAMSFAPLLNASPVIQIHAFAAMAAFGLGVFQLVAPKGTLPHRAVGFVWCALMLAAALGSFRINHINQWQGFSLIHLLSIMVLIQIPLAIWFARTGKIANHQRFMRGMFFFGLVVAGAFTFLPGRIMNAVLFGA